MKLNLLKKIALISILSAALAVSAQPKKELPKQFKTSDESFIQYQYPDWFRDAKFGIWSHWGLRRFRVRVTGMPAICICKAERNGKHAITITM
jgi:hypothetical protein